MKISILTLFPEMYAGPFDHSIIKKAKEAGLVQIRLINIRDFGLTRHSTVDDTPFGGGIGMVLRVDVLCAALKSKVIDSEATHIVLLDARGKKFDQQKAKEFKEFEHLILVCGHYEGVDERIRDYVDEELSLGDFILTGGEIPTMAVTDAVVRLIPSVLKDGATINESFSLLDDSQNILLEYPQYTKPRIFEQQSVPVVLLSGDHASIDKWRKNKAKEITLLNRPDLIKKS